MKLNVIVIMITICWLLPALGWALPMLFFDWGYIGIEDYVMCSSVGACPFIVNVTLNLVDSIPGFFIPSAIMVICYWRIFVAAKRHARAIRDIPYHQEANSQYGSTASKSFKKETKAAFTLGIVIGCFFVCWCPFFLTYLVDALIGYRVPIIIKLIVLWLGYLNSTMNPVLYYISNKDFKVAYKMLFGCNIQQSLLDTSFDLRNS
ncbi:5-hydroxytryptamine receptor 4-like [Gigantopelta aegis]|uniref:5-hydroxytryptamine receptor 4-like n=1 Tax=Gigantopelta aegis TaxID=1735272 RepID=UPI001B888C74|nr:5-hydroxytryptamine receptor 4-like [Gigantopelta aegis]